MDTKDSNLNLIDRFKMKIQKKQDEKVIEKIKRADLEELKWFLENYISELHFDDSKLQIFKLLEDNGAFDKFKNFQVKDCKGVSYENPLIILEALEEDQNKCSLLKYLKEKTTDGNLYRAIAMFSNDEFDADKFVTGIGNKEYREQVLNDLYEITSIGTKIKVMQDMTSEDRARLIAQHKIDGKEAVQLFCLMDDEEVIREYKEDIEEVIFSRKNGKNKDSLQIENGKQALTVLNVFGNNMGSEDIADLIILYENEFAKENNKKCDKNIIKQYAKYMEPAEVDNIFIELTSINPDNLKWFVEEFLGEIDEFSLKTAFGIYNGNIKGGNSEYIQFSQENPHYLYDIANYYYGYRITLDNNFECCDINDVIAEIPIQDRMRFSLEYSSKIENIDQNRIIEELVQSKEEMSINDKLDKYRQFLSSENIANLINSESPQTRIKLITSYDDLPKEVLDEVVKYAENEETKDISAFQRMKFMAGLRKMKNNHTNISIDDSGKNEYIIEPKVESSSTDIQLGDM